MKKLTLNEFIEYQTVINRIHKHKWDYERAITTPNKIKIKNKI